MSDMTEPPAHSDVPSAPDGLEVLLERVAYRTPDGLDVEAALRRVHERMHGAAASPRTAQRAAARGRWRGGTIAAAAAILVAIGLATWQMLAPRPAAGSADGAAIAATPRTLTTAAGQRDSAQLADGSTVVMEPSSALVISAAFATGTRDVQLRGDARFSVRHDASHPFTVHAAGAVITDLGTQFDVHSGTDGVALAVSWGSAKLAAESAPDGVVLNAGDRALRSATLVLAAVELSRWYSMPVVIADTALATRHVTATFSGESAKQALAVITLAVGARYELHGDTAFLRTLSSAASHR
jgi:transmembrane sensor